MTTAIANFTRPGLRAATAVGAAVLLATSLAGCVPLVVGGAAAAGVGVLATDRRSSGAQLDDQGIELRTAARIRDVANDRMNITTVSYNRQVLMIGTVGSEADAFVAKPGRLDHVEAAADRTRWLLDHPPEARVIAARGRERIRERFLTTRLLADELRLYAEVLGNRAQHR